MYIVMAFARRSRLLLFPLLLLAIPLFANELNEVTTDAPHPTELNETAKQVLIFYLNHLGPPSAERSFRIAQFYIQTGDLEEAKKALGDALEIDPSHTPALTQLGFLALWSKDWEEADTFFTSAWNLDPCAPKISLGLIRLAMSWKRSRALEIAEKLHACHLQDPDTLVALSSLEIRLGEPDQAEETLRQCLELSSQNQDALLQLANLYVRKERYEEAEAIYQRYPTNTDALLGRGRIAERKGDFSLAETLYRKTLEKAQKNQDAKEGLARVLAAELQYDQAKEEYSFLLQDNPTETFWIRSMDVKSHTNVALLEELDYTDAKENDPTLGVPVVKDYYFTSKFTVFVPIFNRWRLDLQQVYFHQKENDIYAPSLNYSASINGAALFSHYFFARNWKWDVMLKGIQATGIQNANFPFQRSALFEPGTVLMYNGEWNLFALDAHIEEQIIKNFDYTISQMLRIDVYDGGYGLHPPVTSHPNGEIWVGQNFYHDSIDNWKQYQKIRVDSDFFVAPFRVSYLFEHSRFRKLTSNYFSYKKQIQNMFSVKFFHDFDSKVQFEALWDYFLQMNTNVILPIGTFILISPSLYLIGNRITALLKYRFEDHLRIEISGHYLHVSTLPYQDWNLRGSLFWQF